MKFTLFTTATLLALASAAPLASPGEEGTASTQCFAKRADGILEARQCHYGPSLKRGEEGSECFVRRGDVLEVRQCTYGPLHKRDAMPGTECFVKRADGNLQVRQCTYGKREAKPEPGTQCFVRRDNLIEEEKRCHY